MGSKMFGAYLHRKSGLVNDDLLLSAWEGKKVGIGQHLLLATYSIHFPTPWLRTEFNIKIMEISVGASLVSNFTLGKFGHLCLTFFICKLKAVTSVPYRDIIATNEIICMKTYDSEESGCNCHNSRKHRNQLVFIKIWYIFWLQSIEFLLGVWI